MRSEKLKGLEKELKMYKRQMRRAKTKKEKDKIKKKVFETDFEIVKERLRMIV